MFQDTADMPGMRNELDRSKKNLEEQEIISQELQKKSIVTFAFGLFYICRLNSLLFSTLLNLKWTVRTETKKVMVYVCMAQDIEWP